MPSGAADERTLGVPGHLGVGRSVASMHGRHLHAARRQRARALADVIGDGGADRCEEGREAQLQHRRQSRQARSDRIKTTVCQLMNSSPIPEIQLTRKRGGRA